MLKYSWISYICIPDQFYISSVNWYGDRGVIGGNNGGASNTIEYITITTPSDSIDFGDLTIGRNTLGAVSNGSKGVYMLGSNGGNILDYITISTIGNAIDFGDSINTANNRVNSCATASNGIRGTQSGGYVSNNIIEYITIAILSNTCTFGTLSVTRQWSAGCSGRTRGIVAGGYQSNIIDYFNISILSNAADFGDLTTARYLYTGCGNETKGIFAGGYTTLSSIDYIFTDTLGNAKNFGSLSSRRYESAAAGNNTRAVICTSIMESIEFATNCNGVSFGNMIALSRNMAGCSGN